MFISSNQLSRPAVFEGYAWVGTDLVMGQEGANHYFSQTGKMIQPGEDGCYVLVQDTSDGLRIGTDYRGLKRLFLYRNEFQWAIASSLYELVSNVRRLEWPLTVLEDTISAFLAGVGFSSQLATFEAHFAEVSLVPAGFTLLVIDERVTFEFREAEPQPSYEDALYDFLSTWKNRLSTLVSSSASRLKFDLSGGIDSRAVLAFGLNDGNILRDASRCRIESSTRPAAAKDLEVASEIGSHFGFELNSRIKSKIAINSSESSGIEGWKKHSLAVYSPVYLYNSVASPLVVHAHGAGGGNFRPTYRSIAGKISPLRSALSASDYQIWKHRVINDISALSGFYETVSKELLHYREFRNRFHFGHRPQQSFVYMPLESKLTDPITDRKDDRDGRQFYYDVMESLQPGLSRFSYDTEEKYPTEENQRRLTVVDTPQPQPGNVFYSADESLVNANDREDVFGEWMEGAMSRFNTELVSQVIPSKYLKPVKSTIRGWEAGEKKPGANSLGIKGLSHSLAIDFLLNPATEI